MVSVEKHIGFPDYLFFKKYLLYLKLEAIFDASMVLQFVIMQIMARKKVTMCKGEHPSGR